MTENDVAFCFLIVDDDGETRQTLADYLRKFGYTKIIEAKDGLEALNILRTTKVDFIISDWEMPGVNGIELLKMLRETQTLAHIPFVIITSPISEERDKVEKAAQAHVDSYIIKPFRSNVLREKIDQVLVRKSLEKKGVLVVDDDLEVRSTVVEYLRAMGYDPIFEASDGDEGFASLQLHSAEISFVISDWEMPRLAGIELLRKIREDNRFSYIPFIMVTSQTSIERLKLKRALEADVDNYLLKPFRADDLKTKIQVSVQRAKARLDVEKEIERANAYVAEKKYVDAEKSFNHALNIDPDSLKAHLGLAEIQVHLAPKKGHERALKYIRRAILINPHCLEAHLAMAKTYENAMSLEKAIQCLRDAAKYCDLREELHYHLGRLLLRRGRVAEGSVELKRAIELNPDYTEAKELLETV